MTSMISHEVGWSDGTFTVTIRSTPPRPHLDITISYRAGHGSDASVNGQGHLTQADADELVEAVSRTLAARTTTPSETP